MKSLHENIMLCKENLPRIIIMDEEEMKDDTENEIDIIRYVIVKVSLIYYGFNLLTLHCSPLNSSWKMVLF